MGLVDKRDLTSDNEGLGFFASLKQTSSYKGKAADEYKEKTVQKNLLYIPKTETISISSTNYKDNLVFDVIQEEDKIDTTNCNEKPRIQTANTYNTQTIQNVGSEAKQKEDEEKEEETVQNMEDEKISFISPPIGY